MSLGKVTMGKGDKNTYFCHIPLNFIPYGLCIAYSKTRMFKRFAADIICCMPWEKRNPSHFWGASRTSAEDLPHGLSHLVKMFTEAPNSRQSQTHAPQLSSSQPQPRVQIHVLTPESRLGQADPSTWPATLCLCRELELTSHWEPFKGTCFEPGAVS